VSAAVAFEKLGPLHRAIPAVVGAGLLVLGLAVAFWPRHAMTSM